MRVMSGLRFGGWGVIAGRGLRGRSGRGGRPGAVAYCLASLHGFITQETSSNLKNIVHEIYGMAVGAEKYSDQVTRTNNTLWKSFFHSAQVAMPRLVYMQLEDVSFNTCLLAIMFLPARKYIACYSIQSSVFLLGRETGGIPGIFLQNPKKALFCFGNAARSRYRQRLFLEGESLVSEDRVIG